MNFLRFTLFILLLSVTVISCQKDQAIDLNTKTILKDSTASGNILAVKGLLKISVGDSTYTFDAAQDSIAFINVDVDSNKYFGITAINKAHTMSFGISSSGAASADLVNPIAGGQLLFSADDKHSVQYTLVKNADLPEDENKISLIHYMQDSVITKGTFHTLMTTDAKSNSSSAKVMGSFDLKIK